MANFVHPAKDDISLAAVLDALSDPFRLRILERLLDEEGCQSCSEAAPCPNMAKSTLSHHFRVLRDAGLIRTEKRGVENRNTVRRAEIEALFPGLLDMVLKLDKKQRKRVSA